MTWSESLLHGIGGTVAALVLAARRSGDAALQAPQHLAGSGHRDRGTGGVPRWAMSTVIDVPPAWGADTVWPTPCSRQQWVRCSAW